MYILFFFLVFLGFPHTTLGIRLIPFRDIESAADLREFVTGGSRTRSPLRSRRGEEKQKKKNRKGRGKPLPPGGTAAAASASATATAAAANERLTIALERRQDFGEKKKKKKFLIFHYFSRHQVNHNSYRVMYQKHLPLNGALVNNTVMVNEVSPLFQPEGLITDSLADSSTSGNEYRALRRKYLLLEEESFGLGSELKAVEDDIKTLEEEKLSLLDELVVLEGLIDPSDISPQGQRLP
ncbi:hypothetical protein BUALT_Bualt09G0111900 [Buddleja alternifolia]|uniref:Uncharacterized protein n=1 Tax=Buddleja alternifolia TaxID=168488 RepID=A0AAV6X917_9LAMI|nr:hypothetical protein BUALT_Bualt09G0111900 [Buddleja alternifolia]